MAVARAPQCDPDPVAGPTLWQCGTVAGLESATCCDPALVGGAPRGTYQQTHPERPLPRGMGRIVAWHVWGGQPSPETPGDARGLPEIPRDPRRAVETPTSGGPRRPLETTGDPQIPRRPMETIGDSRSPRSPPGVHRISLEPPRSPSWCLPPARKWRARWGPPPQTEDLGGGGACKCIPLCFKNHWKCRT